MTEPHQPHSPLDYAMMVALALIYGALFSVNKIASLGGAPPLAYSFWQSLGAGVILWVVLTLRRERLGVTRKHLATYVVLGALAVGIPNSILTFIAPKLPAGVMTLVLALSPPFTLTVSVLLRVERFRWLGLFGLLFGFAGVAVIVIPSAALGTSGDWLYFMAAVFAAFLFASSNVAAAILHPPAASSVAMGAGVMLGSSVVILPIMLIAGQGWIPDRFDNGAMATVIAMAMNAAIVVLFLELVRRAGPVFFAQFNYLAVLAGLAWGAVLFGESPTLYAVFAVALMFVGMFLSGLRRANARSLPG